MNNHYKWMGQALDLAHEAKNKGEVPVGAVLVQNGLIIGQGYNQPIISRDPTAHAEIVALRQACASLGNYRLPPETTLYVTLEPCTMCVGAMIHARVSRVVFAAYEPRAGSLVSARQLVGTPAKGFYNHFFTFEGGLREEESRTLLQAFFKQRRLVQKSNTPSRW